MTVKQKGGKDDRFDGIKIFENTVMGDIYRDVEIIQDNTERVGVKSQGSS